MTHSEIYGHAELYDIAFGFQDVPAECDVLVDLARSFGGKEPAGFLELAAGPATHAREMAKRGLRSTAVDLSPEMVAYARNRAAEEGLDLEVIEADMTTFTIREGADVATILMDSLGVLLDNDAVIRHLECVANALNKGGVYVLEMGHPRDVFNVGTSAENDWVMERDGIMVHTTWGRDTDPFDPTTQIVENTVTFTWEREGERGEVTEILPDRSITPNEMRAVVAASGRFEIVTELGAMSLDIPFDNAKASWRYVPVLQRIG